MPWMHLIYCRSFFPGYNSTGYILFIFVWLQLVNLYALNNVVRHDFSALLSFTVGRNNLPSETRREPNCMLLFVLLSCELRERNFVCLTVNAVPC